MSLEVTWLGHGSWALKIGDHQVLLDPFLTDNPVAPGEAGGFGRGLHSGFARTL